MKNSFWDAVGVPFEIKLINAESLSGALEIAYRDSKYCFCGSSWFIDIKDNFRTFKHRGSSYISKRTSEKKADSEIANSQIANKRLKGKVVGSKTIKIVIPQKIISTFDRDHVFLVSEYFGADMNECVYKKTKPNISLEECLLGVKLLLENGISHSGYLPRNIVEKENDIYFFDWEDAIFSEFIPIP